MHLSVEAGAKEVGKKVKMKKVRVKTKLMRRTLVRENAFKLWSESQGSWIQKS